MYTDVVLGKFIAIDSPTINIDMLYRVNESFSITECRYSEKLKSIVIRFELWDSNRIIEMYIPVTEESQPNGEVIANAIYNNKCNAFNEFYIALLKLDQSDCLEQLSYIASYLHVVKGHNLSNAVNDILKAQNAHY